MGEQLSGHFTKHRYNIKNRPVNSKLTKHFHESYNVNDSFHVTIIQNNIKTAAAQGIMRINALVDLNRTWQEH